MACVLTVLTAPLAAAAEIDYRGTSAAGLIGALRQAGDGGTVTVRRDVTFERPVRIPQRGLTLTAADGVTLREGEPTTMLIVEAEGVTLSGLTLEGSFTRAADERARVAVLVRATGLSVTGCTFSRHKWGIRGYGEPPRGTRVIGNRFTDVLNGVAFFRDVLAIPGPDKLRRALDGGRFEIRDNAFVTDRWVDTATGITLDCGSDGNLGSPNFRDPDNPLRRRVEGEVTRFDTEGRSVIAGNLMRLPTRWGMALVRVRGIDVLDNTVIMSTAGGPGAAAFRLENRTADVTLQNNSARASGDRISGFRLIASRRYGNTPAFADGVRDVRLIGNRVFATGGRGLFAEGFAGLVVRDNDLGPVTGGRYVFRELPGGRNEIVAASGNLPADPPR